MIAVSAKPHLWRRFPMCMYTSAKNKLRWANGISYVPSKSALGRACGVSRAVISASITTNEASELMTQVSRVSRALAV